MDVDAAADKTVATMEPVPEVEFYLRLLILHHFLTSQSTYGKAMELVQETVQKMQALSRRSMDPVGAKIWFVVERTYELTGELSDARPQVPHCCPSFLDAETIAILLDCSSLPNALPLFAMMTKPKHP